jgi:hypothetical protein
MAEIVIANADEFRDWSSARLRDQIVCELALVADQLRRVAAMWHTLEGRGEDLSELRCGLAYYLPLIYSGAVAPEAVVAFAGFKKLLKAVAGLPVERQLELAAGGSVPVVMLSGDGHVLKSLPVNSLTAAQVRQVFGERHIRSESEQIAAITTIAHAGRPVRHRNVSIDRKGKVVKVGVAVGSLADLFTALREAGYQVKDAP